MLKALFTEELADRERLRQPPLPEEIDAGPVCAVSVSKDYVVGVVYYRPEQAGDGVWDLTMIALDRVRQGKLVRHVEAACRPLRPDAGRSHVGTSQYVAPGRFSNTRLRPGSNSRGLVGRW